MHDNVDHGNDKLNARRYHCPEPCLESSGLMVITCTCTVYNHVYIGCKCTCLFVDCYNQTQCD